MRNFIVVLFVIANYQIIGSNAKNEQNDMIKVLNNCVELCAPSLNCTEWNECAYHYPDVCRGIQKECPRRSITVNLPDSNATLKVICFVLVLIMSCYTFCYLCYVCDRKFYVPKNKNDENNYAHHEYLEESEKIVIVMNKEDFARLMLSQEIGQFSISGGKNYPMHEKIEIV